MPKFRVVIPAFTRVEETYYVEANSAEEINIDDVHMNADEPDEYEPDLEYYEIRRDQARIEEISETTYQLNKG